MVEAALCCGDAFLHLGEGSFVGVNGNLIHANL